MFEVEGNDEQRKDKEIVDVDFRKCSLGQTAFAAMKPPTKGAEDEASTILSLADIEGLLEQDSGRLRLVRILASQSNFTRSERSSDSLCCV